MAFEYRNPTNGDRLAAIELDGDVWLKTTSKGCLVPPDRVEEVVAGIRDAARTASGQQPETGQGPDPCSACPVFPCRKCAPAGGKPAEAHGTDEARPPTTSWTACKRGDTDWLVASSDYADRDQALERLAKRRKEQPDAKFALVRETTTWTVEDETR
ncbi:hypothetical protein [Streptomyces zaomyceticus]|uniref:hypothetical protein n=1 Tax=Streptomyces zaomyceticus TaxID=68286 RepID=UPI0036AA277A